VHSSTKSEDRKPQIDDLRSQGYWPLAAVVTVVKQTVGHVDLWIKERDRRRTFTVYTSPVIRLETRIQEMYEQGTMMPIFLSTARHGTGTMFGQAFGPSDGIGWRVELQLTKDRLLSLLEEQRAKNWHPTCIAFYEVGGQARYLVILAENRDRWSWSVNLDLMTSEYEQELGKQTQLGFRPRHVFATDDKGVTRYGVIWQGPAVKQSLPTAFTNSFGMEFVLVPKGKSWLGGGKDKLGEKEVEIPADFYLGKYEVTQEEWEKVIGENPSRFSRTVLKDAVQDVSDADQERFPVEYVSWDQCQVFVEKLNQREKETGWVYRLPKELEWEYACRGGNDLTELEYQFDYYFDQPTNTAAPDQANFHHGENALNRTCKVGSYRPNRLGLFDMHGNVWEWCQDEVMFKGVSSRPTLGGGWDFDSTSGRAWFRRSPHPPSHRHQTMGLRLARFPVRAEVPAAQPTVLATSSFTDADVQRIAALPPAEQLEEVRQAMMRLNPGFDGTLTPTIDGGVVTGLKVLTDEVTSVAPLRALTGLTNLDLRGTYLDKGKLSDLSPLKGLALTQLDCSSTQISDLTPLAGMPLRVLAVNHNPVTDLTPLEGMPLVNLGIAQTKVTDLSPLKGLKLKNLGAQLLPVTDLSPLAGMPLTELDLYHTVGVTSLEPLRGLPLAGLNLHDVPVTDLSPLAGMTTLRNLQLQGNAVSDLTPLAGLQLTDVLLRNQQISDLSPLAGMPIVRLHIHDSSVSDLRPLQGMPLQEVLLNPINITQGIDILRAMPSLKTIGIGPNQAWPPAEFWERFDKGEFKE
jgi:formylglycine-generating enzyme required for sulfatase activity